MKDNDLSVVVRNLLDIFPPLFKKTFKQGNFIKNSEITPVLFGIMNFLHHAGPCSMTEISEKKALTISNCSRAVNKLAEIGYIKRETDQKDRRKSQISLNKKGEEYLQESKKQFEEEIKKQLSVLEEDDIKTLKKASDEVYQILSKII